MKRRLVIVGAGLAGSVIASRLADRYAVTVVDLGPKPAPLPFPIIDTDHQARLQPHVGSGPGGTTNYWNNGLIELEDDDFSSWPIEKCDLERYYPAAFETLSKTRAESFKEAHGELIRRYRERGVPESLLANGLFYPRRRYNIWNLLSVERRDVTFVAAKALRFEVRSSGAVSAVVVQSPSGEERIAGDLFVSCAGGLSTPLLVQATAKRHGLTHLGAAGRYYHDHPSGPLGQVRLSLKLHDLWNFTRRGLAGNVWLPLIVRSEGLKFAFQLRPVVQLWPHRRRHKLKSVLIDLRNAPLKLSNYVKLAQNSDDIVEILSFKLGLKWPTSTFSVWVLAEQPPNGTVGRNGEHAIARNCEYDPVYRAKIRAAFNAFIKSFGPAATDVTFFPDAEAELASGAHHSGTCRMADSAESGVCDRDAAVFGLQNLYVCDGSLIPQAGYANTGLTIGALALRLCDTLKERYA